MKYSKIDPLSIANGPGIRVALFVSGCTHHCKGCFNEIAENKLKDAYALLVTSKKYRLSGNLLLSIFYKMLAIMRSKVLLKRTICRIRLKMICVL